MACTGKKDSLEPSWIILRSSHIKQANFISFKKYWKKNVYLGESEKVTLGILCGHRDTNCEVGSWSGFKDSSNSLLGSVCLLFCQLNWQ